ncbi:helix-turn-helix domain-containing protein [Alloprevotella sp. OH1205_COT-284]|uniref:helix-turn-helix domain-containing protein n=1 Tax=Alloprevotella sp. OH1205_COT-284 TaxID=2491043 RepID=UPI000F5FF1D6|nr:helix-turn-helix domain-containing protein [Alloprevotella sp. OH1205_COT-284]RRD79797.1 helix-turn-helix domain-containing protein [Alloprevotella sp. OH1205_COT-284]
MENIYMLSDTEITKKISARLKEVRLKQNISRQEMSASSGVSVSSVVRMEAGEIKSFESFLRILRTLGKMNVLLPLVQEEEMSPNEYFKWVHSAKKTLRKRASKSNNIKKGEDSEW